MSAARRSVVHAFLFLIAFVSSAFLLGCSGGSGNSGNTTTTTTQAAAPAITSVSPTSVTAGAAAFSLTVNGSGFVSGSIVQWNGGSRVTTFVSATQITASITAADVATAGTAQVLVSNTDGQRSSAATFTINAPLALPTITSISPTSTVAGSAAFTLTVNGSGYRAGSQIEWAGTRITTTSVLSSTQLTASIPASFIATAGTVAVAAVNTDTGDRSSTLAFTVTPARPTLTTLAPATATAGSAALTLIVNGTGFTSDAAVAWNGSARTTTFVSATQLSASIPASDLTTAGTAQVDVAQTGVRSTNQLAFTVSAVVPTLVTLSPATVTSGSAAFDLTITGTGFTNAASVTFNGSAKTTTFVSATQIKAAITAADVATAGNAIVDVVQGGIHAANTLTFTITAAAPVITSVSPTSVTTGSADTTLTVNGTGFTANSVVKANGSALTTTFKSSTLLQATVPTASLTGAATISVTVQNPVSEGGASNAVTFTVAAPVGGKIVQLLSPNYQTGAVSNWSSNNSPPTLNQDGRYVAFNSYSSDLVAGDTNGQTDAFLRDTCVGSAPTGCTRSTTRVSLDPTTLNAHGANHLVALSNDARYAAFTSANSRDIDLRDNCIGATGCTPTTAIADYVPGSTDPGVAGTCCAVLSPDGRYVFFSAYYTTPQSTLGRALWVHDSCAGTTGCTPSTTRVALGTGTNPPKQPFQSDISSGGRYVLFRTAGNDIIPTYSTALHLFLQDTCIGAPVGCVVTYTAIDQRANGTEGEGNLANDAAADEEPTFSKDGRYVVFSSTDTQLVAGVTPPHVSEVYLRDTCIGAPTGCVPATTLVSADPTALSKSYRSFIGFRSVSEHGRYVAFMQETLDTTISSFVDVIKVRDTCIGAPAGCVPSISTATLDPDGVAPAHASFMLPSISADSHYVAFMSAGGQVYLALTGY